MTACFPWPVHAELACILCSIDPAAANMILPIAQATIISTPILLRDQIRRGVRLLRVRRAAGRAAPDGPGDARSGEVPANRK